MVRQALAFLLLLVLAAGCGSSSDTTTFTPESRFAAAKALFDDEDYEEAIREFNIITLQYQGSAVAADAQWYLAESRFIREEYLLAQFEFNAFRTSYRANARVPEAQYKIGLCFYYLSYPWRLDQDYTKKAIDELQAFVEYYPAHELAVDAEAKIRELTNRLAQKQYETANLYASMQYYKAALLSYDVIIEKYHDTDWAPLATVEKAEVLLSRLRYREAEQLVNDFLKKYPDSVLRRRAENVKAKVASELEGK